MYWKLTGFGLTVGWLWLFFLSGPVFVAASKGWPGNPDYYFYFFLLCTSISYLVAGKWIGPPSLLKKKSLLVVSCGLMSVCPGLICLLPQLEPNFAVSFPWVIYLLIAGGGWGGTILLFAWLETFLADSVKSFGFSYTGGVVIASLLLFAGTILNKNAAIAVTMALPFLTLPFILMHRHRDVPTVNCPETVPKNINGKVFPAKLLLLIILFYVVGGLMFKLVGSKYIFANFFWISNLSYMVVVIIAGLSLYFSPEMDLRLLSSPVLPLLGAGFILFPFLKGNWTIVSFLFLQAGFALFDMYTWLLIVYIARNVSKPVTALGLGMFLITFSMFAGGSIFTILSIFIKLDRPLDSLAISAGLVTLLASLVFQGDPGTFTGWKTADSEGVATEASNALVQNATDQPTTQSFPDLNVEHIILKRKLTPRESEILLLVLKGRNNPFIRETLNISPNTLKFHLRNIYEKFSVKNRQELISLLNEN